MDLPVLAATVFTALVVTVICGLAPAVFLELRDAEAIVIQLSNGHVVRKEYCRD